MTVTKQQCDDRHSKGKMVMVALLTLTVVFLMLATFAIGQAGTANDRSAEVERDFESHAAAQAVMDSYFKESLQRIEKKLDSLQTERALSSELP